MSEEKGVAEEAKGLADQFVGALGLLDLVAGGIALYWLRLVAGDGAARAFPSTGFEFVDVALLACAASIVGKGVTLVGYGIMASRERRAESSRPYRALRVALGLPADAPEGERTKSAADPVDLALEIVAARAPARVAGIERIQGTALFSYCACVLALPYAAYLLWRRDVLGSMVWALFVGGLTLGALVMWYLGYVYQRHFYGVLAAALEALARPGAAADR
jgi:hypothetical protein